MTRNKFSATNSGLISEATQLFQTSFISKNRVLSTDDRYLQVCLLFCKQVAIGPVTGRSLKSYRSGSHVSNINRYKG